MSEEEILNSIPIKFFSWKYNQRYLQIIAYILTKIKYAALMNNKIGIKVSISF